MGIAERSRARVEGLLSDLEETYGAVPVNQRTLTVPEERYRRARETFDDSAVDTYVKIANDDGEVLHCTDDGESGLPGGVTCPDEAVERDVEERVAEETGIECDIGGLAEVTIAGVSNADADDPVLYRLVVVFDASYRSGEPADGAEWQATEAAVEPAFV